MSNTFHHKRHRCDKPLPCPCGAPMRQTSRSRRFLLCEEIRSLSAVSSPKLRRCMYLSWFVSDLSAGGGWRCIFHVCLLSFFSPRMVVSPLGPAGPDSPRSLFAPAGLGEHCEPRSLGSAFWLACLRRWRSAKHPEAIVNRAWRPAESQ